MKKLALASAAILGSLFLTTAMATTKDSTNGFTFQVYKGVQATIRSTMHPFTDISIINASSDDIYMSTPNVPVTKQIPRGYNGHITNTDPNSYYTYVTLSDPFGNVFFSRSVCRLDILTVYGYPGNYSINEDTELCY